LTEPYLSIIIPAHNEEHRLPRTLEQVLGFLQDQSFASEILVIENGSQDRTLEIARAFAARLPQEANEPRIQVLHEDQPGKGRAIRRGMLAAVGSYLLMCDADLSMPVEEISRFLPPALQDCEVVIASREAPGAVRYEEPLYRHLGGRLVNTMIRLLALPGLHDTQCGFKCFQRQAARDLFSVQRLPGWSFDIEVLYIARRRGYRVVELPIPWYFNQESKLHAVRDALQMMMDIISVHRNAWLGLYDKKPQ
jgi:glycosyltransferase involved in cell wall biosynthesis